jgi:hypothetical protein
MENETRLLEVFEPSEKLYLAGYNLGDSSEITPRPLEELFMIPLSPGRVYAIGRENLDSKPDIQIKDPKKHTSRLAATIYVPASIERLNAGRDYVLLTHLGQNKPNGISLIAQETPKGVLSKTSRIFLGDPLVNRKRDLVGRRTIEFYPGEKISYSNVCLELMASKL